MLCCIKWYFSVISLQNKGSTARVSMAFVPCFLSCVGFSVHATALLIKAARLSSSSIEEFAFPIWCASPAQYTRILLHRSKASKEFIKRNYSKKERGEGDQDIRDVALNKLDGYPILVERTSKGKEGTMSVKLGVNIQKRMWHKVHLHAFVVVCGIKECTVVTLWDRDV